MAGSGNRVRSLSQGTLLGMYFLYKYRFLTIAQFAAAASFSRYHAAEVLRDLEQWGVVDHFGYVGIPGQGKTPKVFYLLRKGWHILRSEHTAKEDELASFTAVREATWTPQMYHRLRLIDLLLSAERAVSSRPQLHMPAVFLSYRMVKRGPLLARETTDYVDDPHTSSNKLVPDAAVVLENTQTQQRALFFVEMDMATERVTSRNPSNFSGTVYSGTSRGVPYKSVLYAVVASQREARLRYHLVTTNSNNTTIQQEYIIVNSELYIWQEGDKQGYIIPLLLDKHFKGWKEHPLRGPECKAWQFDASMFTIPTTIDFELISPLNNTMVHEKFRAIFKPD